MSNPICPYCGKPRPTGSPDGKCPTCLLSLALTPEPPLEAQATASSPHAPGDRISHYKLLEPIGEGGFGTVWMAEQEQPVRRRVALKILKLGLDTREVLARFEAERQALAMMDHPSIARVFDGGTTNQGRPFFVMELVHGVAVTEYCDAERLSTRERLDLFILICEAVQHAHQKGVIHRDLKPGNILVTQQDGRPMPKIIDFGVAKAVEEPLTDKTFFTRLHQFLGTPAYMSPEQAGRGELDVDTRSDIYALGVLLYELLTGRQPFSTDELARRGMDEVLRAIRETEAPPPSTKLSTLADEDLTAIASQRRTEPVKLQRLIRGELDWVLMKALEKDRNRRYQSAHDFAADLRRHLGDEPVMARPPGNFYRLQKFARRNKALFAAVSALAVALIVGLIATGWLFIRASKNLAQARRNAYAAEINLAQRALAENNQSRGLELLERHRPKPSENDLRGFEWRYLWRLSRSNELAHFPNRGDAVALSPDNALLASAGSNIVVREISSHRVVATLPTEALSLAFSARDKILAAGGLTNVTLWNTETWREILPPLPRAAFPVRFTPDGALLLTGATNQKEPRLQLWRADTWEPIASCLATPELPWQLRNAVAFSPDGTLLVTPWLKTPDEICGLKLWKVPSLDLVENIFPAELSSWSAAFLDNQRLLIGTFYGELVVWDIQKRAIIQTIKENNSGINTISTVPGTDVFVTASHDHRVSLWDSRTLRVLARYRGHTHSIWASALSSDGRIIATGSFDWTTKLWDATARESAEQIDDGSLIAGFAHNGQTLVLAPREGDPRWHLVGPKPSRVAVSDDPPLRWDFIHRPYDVFGDIPMGALGRTDGSIELWNLAKGERTRSWRTDSNAITATRFSRDGKRLATGDVKGQVNVWDVHTGERRMIFNLPEKPGHDQPLAQLAFSDDGRTLAGASWPGWPGKVVVWDLESKWPPLYLNGPGGGGDTTVSFSPDGKLLAGGAMGPSEVFVWKLPSGELHARLKGHVTGIVEVGFTPDGKTLATGGYDTVKLWNVATQQEIASLPYRGTFRGLKFSPDERTLALSYLTFPGHRVRLHKAPSFEEIDRAPRLQARP